MTTFAFSLTITFFFLERSFDISNWMTDRGQRIERPPLLGQLDIDSPTRIYYLCLAVLLVMLVCLRGIRQSRTGRALLALRDNERAAQAYAIDAARTPPWLRPRRAIASIAGCLFVHTNRPR